MYGKENMKMDEYLQFGKYTKDCPKWLPDRVKSIKKSEVEHDYIIKILEVIREEFNPERHETTYTNDFKKSRFISVKDVLEKRQRSCGSRATVVASVLRNLNIPTKLVDGLYIKDNPNMRHAWNEVLINDEWLPFDITKRGFEIGEYHIRKGEYVDWSEME